MVLESYHLMSQGKMKGVQHWLIRSKLQWSCFYKSMDFPQYYTVHEQKKVTLKLNDLW